MSDTPGASFERAAGPPPAGDAALDRGLRYLALVAVAVGIGIRLYIFALDRSLWFDEAALATNIVHRPFGALFAPLSWSQTAPPLYLVLEKCLVALFGSGERVLRATSLVAGIAYLPLAYAVARRLTGPRCAAAAVTLLAVSPTLTRYSVELKPYALDAFVGALLLLAALRARDRDFTRIVPLAVLGIVSLLFSTPAIFTLGGIATFMFLQAPLGRRAVAAGILGLAWGATFVLLLATVHRSAGSTTDQMGQFLRVYWSAQFLDVPLAELPRRVLDLYDGMVPQFFLGHPPRHSGAVLAILLAAGAFLFALRSRRRNLVLLATPLVLLVVAARLGEYPLAPRVSLFVALPVAIFLGTALFAWRPATAASAFGLARLGLLALLVIVATTSPLGSAHRGITRLHR